MTASLSTIRSCICPLCGDEIIAVRSGRECPEYGRWWRDERDRRRKPNCPVIPFPHRLITWSLMQHIKLRHNEVRCSCVCGIKLVDPGVRVTFKVRQVVQHLLYLPEQEISKHTVLYAFHHPK